MPRPKKNKQAGAAFKQLLKQRNFTQYKLEQVTGLDKGLISRIATGETANPELTTLAKIAGALGVELGELTSIFAQSPSVRSHSAEVPQRQEQAQKETPSKNTDFVGREEAIADCTPEKELDELVRRVREKRYSKIQDQCGTLRILDVEQEIAIDDLYIDVNVLEEIPSYKHKGFPELLEGLNPDEINRIGFGRHQERLPGLKAVENYRKLMMLGQPGAGKTTFLQHIAIECNQGRFQASCVPIFIRLREFTDDAKDDRDFSLFNYISHEFACCRISEPEQMLTKLLYEGRALILLDGLDEVPEQDREEVLRQIRKFVSYYFRNQFIITCRIAEGLSRFKEFTNAEVADFTLEQIDQFAKKWFITFVKPSNCNEQEGLRKATEFMEKLNENNRIKELAVTNSLNLLRFSVRDLRDEGKLARMLAYDMYWKLFKLLKNLKNQLIKEENSLVEWWKLKGSDWTDKLKVAIIEYRNLGHNLQFSNAQNKLLKQYYDANQLLMDCLNSDCEVTPEVRSHIEDTLLLPIAEIEKRRLAD